MDPEEAFIVKKEVVEEFKSSEFKEDSKPTPTFRKKELGILQNKVYALPNFSYIFTDFIDTVLPLQNNNTHIGITYSLETEAKQTKSEHPAVHVDYEDNLDEDKLNSLIESLNSDLAY